MSKRSNKNRPISAPNSVTGIRPRLNPSSFKISVFTATTGDFSGGIAIYRNAPILPEEILWV